MSRVDVSDHAILRWLERVEGVDVGAIRRRIGRLSENAADKGASGVRIQGVTFYLGYDHARPVVTTTHSNRVRPHLAEPRRPFDKAD